MFGPLFWHWRKSRLSHRRLSMGPDSSTLQFRHRSAWQTSKACSSGLGAHKVTVLSVVGSGNPSGFAVTAGTEGWFCRERCKARLAKRSGILTAKPP